MEDVALASEELLAVMHKSLGLLRELVELSKEKEAYLTSSDIEGLRSATEKEEEIIAALALTENDRMFKADALSQAIGFFDKDVKLKDIIDHVGDPLLRERLTEIRNELTESVNVLSAQNEKLKQLLMLQIDVTDYMLRLLYTSKSRNQSYDVQGSRKEVSNELSMLDLHV